MTRPTKVTSAVSLALLALSIPTCRWGERTVHSEMAKYPAEFVSAHKFDMIFARWALPGILMFMLGGVLAVVAIVLWFVERNTAKQQAIVERFRP